VTFVRANPPGWALFELLTSSQMNTVDSQMPFALDGRDGGTYTPTALLTWNERVVLDATAGAAAPGPTLDILSETGEDGLRTLGGADGGRGVFAKGGVRTAGIRSLGGASDSGVIAGFGAELVGGNNASTGQGGHGDEELIGKIHPNELWDLPD